MHSRGDLLPLDVDVHISYLFVFVWLIDLLMDWLIIDWSLAGAVVVANITDYWWVLVIIAVLLFIIILIIICCICCKRCKGDTYYGNSLLWLLVEYPVKLECYLLTCQFPPCIVQFQLCQSSCELA